MPWPRSADAQEQLAALDREEAIGPVDVTAYGVELAGLRRASCIVVGHRRPENGRADLGSTAYELAHHANRPVLLVPTPVGQMTP